MLVNQNDSAEMLLDSDPIGNYFFYETSMTLLALLINGIAFCTVGPRADDYSGFIIVLCSAMDMVCMIMHLFSRIVS
jgi:hypothetical protein